MATRSSNGPIRPAGTQVPAGPPSALAITGYTDPNGNQSFPNPSLGPAFQVNGTLSGFITSSDDNVYGLLFTAMGSLVTTVGPTAAAQSWQLAFDLITLGLPPGPVTYFLKAAYHSSIHDDSSAGDSLTVNF
jgi:hypothetical protein